jgi:hypothetical protein
LELRIAKNDPRQRVTNVEKRLTLSESIEKLQHFEINFERKKSMQNSDFWQF